MEMYYCVNIVLGTKLDTYLFCPHHQALDHSVSFLAKTDSFRSLLSETFLKFPYISKRHSIFN